jgi:PAS domain S-box-containing protein
MTARPSVEHRRAIEELNRVSTQLSESQEALRDTQARFQAVFENAGDAMIIADPAGRFLELNRTAAQLLGVDRVTVLGERIGKFVRNGEAIAVQLNFESGPKARRGEFAMIRADGEVRWVEYTATVDVVEGQHLLILRDVSQRKQQEQEIRELNSSLEDRVRQRTAELEDINRELEAFSYSVSHDLRAPFRHIVSFSDLLQRRAGSNLDDTGRNYLKRIADAAIYSGRLVDDLLSFSQMARMQMQSAAVNLTELVQELLPTVMEGTNDRKVEWKIADLPAVEGDVFMLRLVFENLLSNALKYTRPRAVAEIEIGLQPHPARPELVVVFVRDNGVGFDPRYAHKLFGVFQRLHRSEDFEGTGIGLANVKRIVMRHGGDVWAESNIGKGATFYVALPRAKEVAQDAIATP